jgi:hypothetical protein
MGILPPFAAFCFSDRQNFNTMKKLFLFLVLGIAPAFVPPAAAQIVAVPPCLPTTTCLLNTDNVFTGRNQFNKGIVPGQLTVAQLQGLQNPSFGTLATVLNAANSSDCTAGGGTSTVVCMFAGSWIAVGTGAGGVNCPAGTPALPYFDATNLQCDQFAGLDGAGNFHAVSVTATGLVSALSFGTSGAGGLLKLHAQTPPGSVPLTEFWVFLNTNTGLLGCRNNALGDCLGAVQFVVSGSTVLPATLVTANGGCNVYSSTATGATSSNGAYTSLHGVDVSAVSGYGPGQLLVYPPFVGTNLISFKVCNPTTSNITPGASITVFWDIK